jgi:hypothetical protein
MAEVKKSPRKEFQSTPELERGKDRSRYQVAFTAILGVA